MPEEGTNLPERDYWTIPKLSGTFEDNFHKNGPLCEKMLNTDIFLEGFLEVFKRMRAKSIDSKIEDLLSNALDTYQKMQFEVTREYCIGEGMFYGLLNTEIDRLNSCYGPKKNKLIMLPKISDTGLWNFEKVMWPIGFVTGGAIEQFNIMCNEDELLGKVIMRKARDYSDYFEFKEKYTKKDIVCQLNSTRFVGINELYDLLDRQIERNHLEETFKVI